MREVTSVALVTSSAMTSSHAQGSDVSPRHRPPAVTPSQSWCDNWRTNVIENPKRYSAKWDECPRQARVGVPGGSTLDLFCSYVTDSSWCFRLAGVRPAVQQTAVGRESTNNERSAVNTSWWRQFVRLKLQFKNSSAEAVEKDACSLRCDWTHV